MKIITLLLLLFVLTTCNEKKVKNINIVGNDKDAYGCIGSAGFTWSYSKKRCIRIWEEGTRFEIYNSDTTSDIENVEVIYVILSDDKSIAEIFFNNNKTILLNRQDISDGDIEPFIFKNDDLNVKIQFKKDVYWIVVDNVRSYFNNDLTENSFGKKLW